MSKSKCTTNDFTWGCSKVREVINTEKYQYNQKKITALEVFSIGLEIRS